MIEYCGDSSNVNDLYLRNCFYWAAKNGLKDRVVQITAGGQTKDIKADKFILMITGNENHHCLDHYYEDSRVLAIVKNYPWIKNTAKNKRIESSFDVHTVDNAPRFQTLPEDPRTLNIPLGITNDFEAYNLPDRVYRTGFIGQWTKIRESYIERIGNYLAEKSEDLDQFQFAFYSGFGPFVQGSEDDGSLPTAVYSVNLANYGMSLCFSGQSPETFRLYEAASSGCGIISTPLPNTWYYRHLPALYILPEFNFEDLMYRTIMDDTIVKDYRKATTSWYHQYASPKAVGNKIANHIKGLE